MALRLPILASSPDREDATRPPPTSQTNHQPPLRRRTNGIMKPEVSLLASTALSLEQEKNPWLAAEARFDEAATRLNMDDGLRKVLRTSAREITVHIARGPGKGGIRFAPDVTLDEVRLLSLSEMERLTRRYTSEIMEFPGPEVEMRRSGFPVRPLSREPAA